MALCGQASSLTEGTSTCARSGRNDQCSVNSAPCLIHSAKSRFSSAVSVRRESGGGIRSSSSSLVIRTDEFALVRLAGHEHALGNAVATIQPHVRPGATRRPARGSGSTCRKGSGGFRGRSRSSPLARQRGRRSPPAIAVRRMTRERPSTLFPLVPFTRKGIEIGRDGPLFALYLRPILPDRFCILPRDKRCAEIR